MAEEKVINQIPAVWLHCSSCSGCSVSVLNSVSPTIKNLIVDDILPGKKINLLFQEVIMAASGEPALRVLSRAGREEAGKYVLVIEGAIPDKGAGLCGTIGEEAGKPQSMAAVAGRLASQAAFIIALGTCASFGGISAAAPNPSGAKGTAQFLKDKRIDKPLLCVPGCPPHPDWFGGSVAQVLLRGLPGKEDVDEFNRLRRFYGKLIHESCPRRADFDVNRFAKKLSDEGCLYELGCKGPVTYADCSLRQWNTAVNWCIRSGTPCLGCCEPEFPDVNGPYYEKTIPIPIEEE